MKLEQTLKLGGVFLFKISMMFLILHHRNLILKAQSFRKKRSISQGSSSKYYLWAKCHIQKLFFSSHFFSLRANIHYKILILNICRLMARRRHILLYELYRVDLDLNLDCNEMVLFWPLCMHLTGNFVRIFSCTLVFRRTSDRDSSVPSKMVSVFSTN